MHGRAAGILEATITHAKEHLALLWIISWEASQEPSRSEVADVDVGIIGFAPTLLCRCSLRMRIAVGHRPTESVS